MAFFKKLSRKINTRIFEKSTMMGRFFENTLKRAGVFTPAPTVETSILCLFQQSQLQLLELQYSVCLKKKRIFFGGMPWSSCFLHVITRGFLRTCYYM